MHCQWTQCNGNKLFQCHKIACSVRELTEMPLDWMQAHRNACNANVLHVVSMNYFKVSEVNAISVTSMKCQWIECYFNELNASWMNWMQWQGAKCSERELNATSVKRMQCHSIECSVNELNAMQLHWMLVNEWIAMSVNCIQHPWIKCNVNQFNAASLKWMQCDWRKCNATELNANRLNAASMNWMQCQWTKCSVSELNAMFIS